MYESLREEIIESGFLTLSEWKEFVALKAAKYLKSNRVRKMTAGRAYGGTTTGQIEKGKPLTVQHLFAVILYCDFGPLCTAFSESMRMMNVFEDLESLVLRHSKFAHFGRFLVEMVVDHGVNGYESMFGDAESERGPFFCGINCPLQFGSYAITFKGPCSTTTAHSVSLNFAKSNGLILCIQNHQENNNRNQLLLIKRHT